MSFLDEISVLILTYNERPNIARTLDALIRFSDVVVVDSGSTDGTVDIVARYANARCAIRPFDTHAAQWDYGLTSCGIQRPWVLALDADFVLADGLIEEIASLSPDSDVSGYRVGFRYCIFDVPLSGTLYPPVVALYLRHRAHYIQDGHTQRVVISGQVKDLKGRIDHNDHKDLSRWFSAQREYSKLEASHLLDMPPENLRSVDKIRLLGWPAPVFTFFYALVVKGCFLDGWRGWLYVLQRTVAELMIALEIVDRRLRPKAEKSSNRKVDKPARG